MRRVMLIATALIAVGGCGGDGDSESGSESGIRGVVLSGPTCAVEVVGEDCADEPYATELGIIDTSSEEQVATASSGSDGRFEIALPTGRYRIEPLSPDTLPSAAPVEVAVPPRGYATATIRFDSGIR